MRYMYEEEINIEAFLPSLNNIPVNEVVKSILSPAIDYIEEQVDYG